MPRRSRPWQALAGLALLPVLASCDDGNNYCYNCGIAPFEVSQGVVAGNFNGSGFASIVALNSNEPETGAFPDDLKVYLSTAAGSYAPPVYVPDGTEPLYVASADLNGDGLPDVVSASFADGTLAVFFNNKAQPGTFNTPLVLTSPGASQVAIGDMNHDGLPDLVSADFGVSLFVQTSPGTFAAPISLYSGGANWVAVGDLNGDGNEDIALTDAIGVKVLLHTGAASATTYAAPVSVFTQSANAYVNGANLIAIADVNGDGANDLVITDPGPSGGAGPDGQYPAAESGQSRHLPGSGQLSDCDAGSVPVDRAQGRGWRWPFGYRHRRNADRHGAAAESRAGDAGYLRGRDDLHGAGRERDCGGGCQW